MPYLDDNDPIVLLATKIHNQIDDGESTHIAVCALSSVLGSLIDIAIEDGVAPSDFVILREMLVRSVSMIVLARNDMAAQRES